MEKSKTQELKPNMELEMGVLDKSLEKMTDKLEQMSSDGSERELPGLCSIETLRDLLEGGENAEHFDNKATFLNNGTLFFNLLFFGILWTTAFFDYYMLSFVIKYIPGNMHVNNIASGSAELLSLFFPLFYLERFGIKLALLMALVCQILGGLFIMMTEQGMINAVFVLCAKAGASITMNVCQLYPSLVFPAHLRTKAYGIVELAARLLLIACPLVVEMPAPVPMMVFTVSSTACIFLVFYLKS